MIDAQLLAIRQRRLEVLLQQRAAFGELLVPPHIVISIEQTQAEITQLCQERTQQIPRPSELISTTATPAHGLILLISPRRSTERLEDMASYQAILYHLRQLTHCWLIATTGEGGSLATAQELVRYFPHVKSTIWQVFDPTHVDETFALVEHIYTTDIPAAGLTAAIVIADITGGSKPMTAGMVLACGSQRTMQYMVYQPEGPSRPIMLRVEAGQQTS